MFSVEQENNRKPIFVIVCLNAKRVAVHMPITICVKRIRKIQQQQQ